MVEASFLALVVEASRNQISRRIGNDNEIRQKVEHLKQDLRERNPQGVEDNLLSEAALILKASIWARSEDPRRLADLTGIPLGEVQELAEGFKQMGVWPLVVEP